MDSVKIERGSFVDFVTAKQTLLLDASIIAAIDNNHVVYIGAIVKQDKVIFTLTLENSKAEVIAFVKDKDPNKLVTIYSNYLDCYFLED